MDEYAYMGVVDLRELEVPHLFVDLSNVLVRVVQHEDVLVDLRIQQSLVFQDACIAVAGFLVLLCLLELEGLVQFLVEAFITELLRDASRLPHSLVGLANTERQNRL